MNIGDLFLQLLADGSKLTASVQKEAEKAGTVGAQTLGQKMSTGLKTAGVKAFGVAASGAFAIAAKGALELENVQAEIIAQTGMAADEAARTASVVNRVAGENRMSLQSVQDIAIAVHNDLGLVGEEADAATARIAAFARVTRQEGAAAVGALDDVTDAWNLTSAETLSLTDQLLVSQQKYGGSIADNTDALAKLAPQLQALGAGLDDGIGLLNLFSASGIDSSKAVAALNTAVKNLKPGETLDDLVARLAAIEDPTKRAQEAIRIFGSRGGVALANALKPGVDSLEEFAITADESAGAVAASAEALDSTFSGRIQKAISVATAALREFGAGFGPALSGIASVGTFAATVFPGFGSKMAGGIGKGLTASKDLITKPIVAAIEGVTSSAGFQSATSKIGSFMGTKIGAAITLAVADIASRAVLGEISKQYSKNIAEAVEAGNLEGLKNARIAAAAQLAALPEFTKFADVGGLRASAQGQLDEVDRAIAEVEAHVTVGGEAIGDSFDRAVVDGVEAGTPEVVSAVQSVGYAAADSLKASRAKETAHEVGASIPEGFAEGVIANRNRVGDAFSSLMSFIDNFRRRGPQIAQIIGELTGKRLADALNDKRPEIRRAAEAFQMDAIAELQKLVDKGDGIGKKGGAALAKALKSKNPEVRTAAQKLKNTLDGQLDQAAPAAEKSGTAAGNAFANGAQSALSSRTLTLNIEVAGGGGKNVANKDSGHAGGGREYRGLPRLVGERGPEVFVPNAGGYTVSRTDAISALGGGGGMGDTYINMPVSGALPVRTISDISTEMQRIDDSGILPDKLIAPRYRRREAAGVGSRR